MGAPVILIERPRRVGKTAGLAALLLAQGACGGKERPPVTVPVPVPCIKQMPEKPVYPTVGDGDGLFQRVQKLLAERELRIAYEQRMEATLEACR